MKPLPVLSGVPQRSILGPLLFILYMNSINSLPLSNTSKLILFADILLYKVTNSPQHLQSDITKLCQWVKQAGLNLNTGKTKFMIISQKRSPPTTHLYINNTLLEQVTSYKYLRVVISFKLQWSNHVHYISNKARKRLGFIYRNMRSASIAAKMHLYKPPSFLSWIIVVVSGHPTIPLKLMSLSLSSSLRLESSLTTGILAPPL